MKHKRPSILVTIVVVVVVLVGGYFGVRALVNKSGTPLTASGTIEAIEVTISPEIGGKVTEVSVDEGAQVKAGDALFRLDDTLLQGQRAVAAASLNLAQAAASTANAALVTAQANYDLAINAVRLGSAPTRTSDWHTANPPGYTLPDGYFSSNVEINAAQAEVDAASSTASSAQNSLSVMLADPANAAFVAAETRLVNSRAAAVVAQDVQTRAMAANNADLKDSAQTAYDTGRSELDNAQAAYDALKDTVSANQIIKARADQAVAQEQYESAQDRLLALQINTGSPSLSAALAALHQAQAAANQAVLATTQADASLALIDIQIGKLTITAPADGVILSRSIQPGEIVAPNSPALNLGRLDNLTITVYVPENLYGELSLGQSATMTVDSYPGETFAATIIHIADQSEFTPRNVQTVEGRSSTVFAIKLQVLDLAGKLKPGMPADVSFTP